jgi:hypothetical protein
MLMNRDIQKMICRICLAGLLAVVGAWADPITGAGSWQEFPATLQLDGTPFYDRYSFDGLKGNVGYFLSGYEGAYSTTSLHVTPEWYGDVAGQSVTDYYFNLTHAQLTATLRLENSARSLINEFGWYSVANPSVLNPIFAGADAVGATVSFTPSETYGYYLTSGLGETYYTQSILNSSAETNHQHFAAFRDPLAAEPDRTWIAVEDLALRDCGAEVRGDYNDVVVEIVGAPEPATGLLAGGSLLVLAMVLGWARKRAGRASSGR